MECSHKPAVADNTFIAAVLILPLTVSYSRIRAPVTDTSISRSPLAPHIHLSPRNRRRTRQRVTPGWAHMYHLLLLLLGNLNLLHLLLRYLRKFNAHFFSRSFPFSFFLSFFVSFFLFCILHFAY